MLTSNIDLQELQSHRIETLFLSGQGFQMQKIFTLTDSQTYYTALDPTAMIGTGKRLGILPLILQSTAGLCYAYTYVSPLSSTGSEVTPIPINAVSPVLPLCKQYVGATPTITSPSNAREYVIGAKSTNQSAGGGALSIGATKQLPITSPTILKIVNQETSTNVISVGICWFEF